MPLLVQNGKIQDKYMYRIQKSYCNDACKKFKYIYMWYKQSRLIFKKKNNILKLNYSTVSSKINVQKEINKKK